MANDKSDDTYKIVLCDQNIFQHFESTVGIDSEDKFFKFNPPLYIQRYDYVSDLLKKYKCETYMDIGCAECKLLRHVKNFNPEVKFIVGIDFDNYVLDNAKEFLQPFSVEFVRKRENPLELHLFKGDISIFPQNLIDNYLNYGSLDCVSLVEVIEHMYPDCLAKTVDVVFGMLRPRIVVMTTPNAEFNVIFEKKNESDSLGSVPTKKFRHYDHKFEWTRNEFQQWCLQIMEKYKDTYEKCLFDGVGLAPANYTHVGMCSQVAIFFHKNLTDMNNNDDKKNEVNQLSILKAHIKRLEEAKSLANHVEPFFGEKILFDNDYKLIESIQYPFQIKTESDLEEDVANAISWLIYFVIAPKTYQNDAIKLSEEEINEFYENGLDVYDEFVQLISIEHLTEYASIKKFNLNLEEVTRIIESRYEVAKSKKFIIYYRRDPDDDRFKHSDESFTEDEVNRNVAIPNDEIKFVDEDWSKDCVEIAKTNKKKHEKLEEKTSKLQFEDVSSEEDTVQSSFGDKHLYEFKIDFNALKKPNNYFYDESKELSRKLRAIKKNNYNQLKKLNFSERVDQFESAAED